MIDKTAGTRRVRVSYTPTDHGLGLAITDSGTDGTDGTDRTDGTDTDGVLNIGDAVITLELERGDGGTAVLAWDPAEVTWDAVLGGARSSSSS